jgi:hypothetical protein
MIVKDVVSLAKKLYKACEKGEEILCVNLNYVGTDIDIEVHVRAEAFLDHFKKYTVATTPYTSFPYKATAAVDDVTFLALFSKGEVEKHVIDINELEDR